MSENVAHAYDRWSTSYDLEPNATRDLDALALRTSDLPVTGAAVLEIGCGTGKNTEWLASQALAVTAMDFSSGMLARARQRVSARHVCFVEHDVRDAWPVTSSSIDLVVGNLVLEHVQHMSPLYAEAVRVLRPGGTLFWCELHPFRQWRGGQAHFTAADTREVVQVSAYTHPVSDYVNDGIGAGLTLVHVGEWLEDEAAPGTLPRLLSVRFVKR